MFPPASRGCDSRQPPDPWLRRLFCIAAVRQLVAAGDAFAIMAVHNVMQRIQVWGAKSRGTGFAAVLVNAATLIGSNVVTAGLGVVYWPLAARSFAVADVGMASAALAATMLLGSLSAFGTTTLLVGELPRRSTIDRSRLVVTAMLVTGLAGAVLGVAFAVVAPLLSAELRSFVGEWDSAALVVLMVSLTAISGVVDHALIGLLRGEVQFGRNTLMAVVKLGALVVVAGLPVPNRALALYSTWLVGTMASFAVIVPLAGFGRLPRGAYRPQLEMLRHLGRSALQHHALNLSLQVPGSVLPLVVTVLLSATANAYFYVATTFASMVYMIPLALSTTLYAVSSHAPAALASRTRLTFVLSVAAGLLANVFALVAARPILSLIGRGYVDEVDWVLRILLIGVFPIIVKVHFVALSQIRKRVGRAAIFVSIAGVVEIGSAALGAVLGDLHTLTVAYVLTICAEGVILAPIVMRMAAQDTPGDRA
jgi:O-antigen/teichoic acid export membrane protein